MTITNCPRLQRINCYLCWKIKELIITGCPQVNELNCDTNLIENLELSELVALTRLNCSNNRLTKLNINNNHQLKILSCEKNRLSELDLSNNSRLVLIDYKDNPLVKSPHYFQQQRKKKIKSLKQKLNESEQKVRDLKIQNGSIRTSVQQWFDDRYQNKKRDITSLNVTAKNVTGLIDEEQEAGELLIADFPVLEEITINHQSNISKVIINNCPHLSSLNLFYNTSLSSIDISDLDSLNYLSVDENLKSSISWPIKKEKAEFERKLSDKNGQIENLQEQARRLDLQLKESVRQRTNLEEQLNINLAKIGELEKEKEKIERKKESEISQLKNSSKREEEKYQNSLQQKSQEITKLKNEVKVQNEKINGIEKYIQDLTDTERNLREQLQMSKEDKRSLEVLRNQLFLEVGNLKGKTTKLESEINNKTRELEQSNLERAEITRKLKEVEENLKELNESKFTENEKKIKDAFLAILNPMLSHGLQEYNFLQIRTKVNELRNLNLFGNPNLGEDLPMSFSETISALLNQHEERKEKSERNSKEKGRLQEEEKQARKWFKIEEIESYPDYIRIELNKLVFSLPSRNNNGLFRRPVSNDAENGSNLVDGKCIYLTNRYPFNQYRAGDEIEIDVEALKNKNSSENFDNFFLVKRAQRNKKTLYDWWEEGKITREERRKLLEVSEIDSSPWFSLLELKKLFHYEELVENNREKINIKGKIQNIILFSTWFNGNCIFITSGEKDYNVALIIYKFPKESMPEILEVIKFPENYSSEQDIKNKLSFLEARLNGENPILYKDSLELVYDNDYLWPNVKKLDITVNSDVEKNPDKYFEPLDIIRSFDGEKLSHCRIYLGNKKICHAFVKNSIDNWEATSGQHIIRYYLSIPSKSPKKLIEHIAKVCTDEENYYKVRGIYSREKNNCEHFTNLCVLGIDISEHVEKEKVKMEHPEQKKEIKINNLKEKLEENDKFFSELISESQKKRWRRKLRK